MAFDIKGFYAEMDMTADEQAAVDAILGKPERVQKLEKGYLRQSDYSKQMNLLNTEKSKLTTAQERLDAEAAEWASLSASEKAAATTLRENLDKSEQRVLALQQRVTKIATDNGLDPAKVLEGIEEVKPTKREEPTPVDTTKFVGADQFAQFGNFMFDLAVEIPAIVQEHFDLTGERLDPRALAAEIKARAGTKGADLNPRTVWEDKYGIGDKRTAKSAAARQAELDEAKKQGYNQARSEAALPIPPSNGVNSPVLRNAAGEGHKSVLNRPAPETGVRGAAAALATGKYRQAGQPAAAAQ